MPDLARERKCTERLISTLLQRLDMNWRNLADQLVLFFFTSNVPQVIDPAFLRRAGGEIVQFGRLDRHAFSAVLLKQIRDRPLQPPGEGPLRRNGKVRELDLPMLADPATRLVTPGGRHFV